jgi:microcystin degradation protein MlrC
VTRLRLAFARINQETNALSPVATRLADFESAHYLTGDDLLRAASKGGHEVAGFFKRAELAGFVEACRAGGDVEPLPILSAWASSSGPLERACFDTLVERLVDGIRRAGPVDGVYLCLHGAMGVAGVRDPETAILRAARDAAGGAPIVTTHDLHGNLTRERVAAADAIVAYATNPHRDHAKRGRRAGDILIRSLRGTATPVQAWRSLPLILGGGKTIDFLAPMAAVFRRMKKMERDRRVLAASTFMVHPWNADPCLGWSTIVVTDGDRELAERYADELAEMCWARRDEQPPHFPSPSEAIATARRARIRRKLGVVTMADASDVVTAGAPGDSTHLLRALIEDGGGMLTYAAVRDPVAIATLWEREIGDDVDAVVGGSLDPSRSPPLAVRGRVLSKHERPGFLRSVVLEIDRLGGSAPAPPAKPAGSPPPLAPLGHVRLVVTEGPAMVMKPAFYADVGLDVWRADVVMVKNFFPFLLFFLPYNRKTIFVRTRGTTDFEAAFDLAFDGPVHPRDRVDDWRARDRERRATSAP